MKYLIVGLGNIGSEYQHTRHNIGFDMADALAIKLGITYELSKLAIYGKGTFKGHQIHIIKPTTYMNLSGRALKYYKTLLDIPTENCFVLVDDLALPFGQLRIRTKGSSAGHNGLKSIEEELQTQEYPRLKFGLGNDFPRGRQVEFVLGKWNKDELEKLPERIQTATEIITSICTAGIQHTMNLYNNK